jgi:hypothetical protein
MDYFLLELCEDWAKVAGACDRRVLQFGSVLFPTRGAICALTTEFLILRVAKRS